MAAKVADASEDTATRFRVRGRAAIALGCEGAALPITELFAGQGMAINDRPSLGLLNAVLGKAHAAALRGDDTTARRLQAEGRRVFDQAGFHKQTSDYAVPHWRLDVITSLLAARLGDETTAVAAQDAARADSRWRARPGRGVRTPWGRRRPRSA
ncbi:hypothetical protein [Streptomyces sp. NPDC085540]|uniref:hypothetical protein n=1 Tax=Streptomyces sp. NPDC085540 TaxID=3365730 RepID=UPI0037D128B9